jgi:hypothetical protein
MRASSLCFLGQEIRSPFLLRQVWPDTKKISLENSKHILSCIMESCHIFLLYVEPKRNLSLVAHQILANLVFFRGRLS